MYILITPMLNEADNLPTLKETIFNQTIKPVTWIICDGKSNDRCFEKAIEMFKQYPWIHVIKQKKFSEKGYSHKNFSNGVNDAYDYARKVCAENNIQYSYVGKTDATPILSPDYFEILMHEMDKDPKIAFTCGLQYLCRQGSTVNVKDKSNCELSDGLNDIRLYRREFIEEMGGYPLTNSPDAVLFIKAVNRGLKVRKTNKTYLIETRVGGTKIGFWDGYKLKGKGMYMLGYNPLLLMLNALYFLRSYPHYHGLALMYGYVLAFIKREERVDDKEVIDYFWRKRLIQIAKGHFTEGNIS